MADVLNTMVKHDGEIIGQPGDKVPSELSDQPSPVEDVSLADYMKATGAVVSTEEYERETSDEANAPIVFGGQGPTPEQVGEVTGETTIEDPTPPNNADREPSKTGEEVEGDGGPDATDDKPEAAPTAARTSARSSSKASDS